MNASTLARTWKSSQKSNCGCSAPGPSATQLDLQKEREADAVESYCKHSSTETRKSLYIFLTILESAIEHLEPRCYKLKRRRSH
jgi:hypothetical protein